MKQYFITGFIFSLFTFQANSTRKTPIPPKKIQNLENKSKPNKSHKEKLESTDKQPARKLRKKKNINYAVNDTESGDNVDDNESDYEAVTQPSSSEVESDEDEIFEETKFNVRTPKTKNTPKANSTGSKGKSPLVVDLLDDDDDFEVSSKPLVKKKTSTSPQTRKRVQILSSDEDDTDDSWNGNNGFVNEGK